MITLKNTELINQLKVKLNQDTDIFHESDLLMIEEIHLNSKNFSDEFSLVVVEELKYLKNLKILKLSNIKFTNADIQVIKSLDNLEELNFNNCHFDENVNLSDFNIDKLTLDDCIINDDSFVYELTYLKELHVIKSHLNFSKLNKFYFLKVLNVSSSVVVKVDEMNLPLLERIDVDFSNITNFEFLLKLKNLKKLSASREQLNENKSIIKTLIDNGVEVYENNIIKIEEIE